jgi:hypothetical protein
MNMKIIGITLAFAATITGGVLAVAAGAVAEGSKLQSRGEDGSLSLLSIPGRLP